MNSQINNWILVCNSDEIDLEDLKRFDPGVQGEHKIKRGFWPIETFSAHWIKDERFREAISNFLITERKHVHLYKKQCKSLLPFKSSIIQNFNP